MLNKNQPLTCDNCCGRRTLASLMRWNQRAAQGICLRIYFEELRSRKLQTPILIWTHKCCHFKEPRPQQTYLTFYAQSVAWSHHNSTAHPSGIITIRLQSWPNINFEAPTFPISHQAIVMWSTLSALRHHSPDVRRPSVLSMNSWGGGAALKTPAKMEKKPQPKSSKINHCISINSKQGYLAIMYLDALTIIT